MHDLNFEWDETKAALNLAKHGVSFEEATKTFVDDWAVLIADPDHSTQEDRFVLIGRSASLHILVVVHVYKEDIGMIRLISARRANRMEEYQYYSRWKR